MKVHGWMLIGATAAAAVGAGGCGPRDTKCVRADTRCECGGCPPARIVVTPDNVLKDIHIGRDETFVQCYTARAWTMEGGTADVTNAAAWTTDRPALGSFNGPCFNSAPKIAAGGILRIRASLSGSAGEVALVIKLHGEAENDGVGPPAFAGVANTKPAAKPRLVYPLEDSIHARNITQMSFQFTAGDGNQVFMARVTSPQMDYRTYFRPAKCDSGRCQWQVPPAQWSTIAVTNAGTTARLTISGASGAPDSPVALSDSVSLTFSPENVKGALYYFSTSLPGILRLPFDEKAGTKATPFIIPQSPSNPQRCSGCHGITQDGTKITATYGQGDDFLGIASGADATRFAMRPGTVRSNFQWFNADGTKIISNFDGELILRDGNTGAELSRVQPADIGPPGKQRAAMPEWSHDGRRAVLVRLVADSDLFYDCLGQSKPGGDWLLCNGGQIVTMAYEDGRFIDPKVVVDLGEGKDYHYYPTWSPDDQWIIFNSGSQPGFSPFAQGPTGYGVPSSKLVSYDQKTSRLRLVRSTGGGVIELAKATVAIGVTASWPKFTPFVQKQGKLMFFTYSSKMDYGFVVTGGLQPQLWMSAIDLGKIGENAADPSYAPAWLPFQDETQANHLAVWTTRFVCEKPSDCPAEFSCIDGRCGCDLDRGCKPM